MLLNLSSGISLTREMMPEERVQKFHTDDINMHSGESVIQSIRGTTQIWVVMHQQ